MKQLNIDVGVSSAPSKAGEQIKRGRFEVLRYVWSDCNAERSINIIGASMSAGSRRAGPI